MSDLVLTFKKPVTFEGKQYEAIDLTKLEDWTCDDIVNVTKKFNKMAAVEAASGVINQMDVMVNAALPEANLEYCQFVAAEATGLPLDFFKRLPAREVGAFRSTIIRFFHGTA